jgi:large subunit ribosomal protein L25
VQHHNITGAPIHADFRAIDENTEIVAHVPLHLEGEPVGVKNGGGVLEHTVHSLEIRCLPNDLPSLLHADVTSLEIGDSLHIGDLKLPTGVVATHAASVVVAHLGKPRVVEIVAVVEKAAPAKGKKK